MLFNLAQYSQAEADFSKALELNPDLGTGVFFKSLYKFRAICRHSLGNFRGVVGRFCSTPACAQETCHLLRRLVRQRNRALEIPPPHLRGQPVQAEVPPQESMGPARVEGMAGGSHRLSPLREAHGWVESSARLEGAGASPARDRSPGPSTPSTASAPTGPR
ncbi:MAG: tetratricopeptide repeat protein [Armatimonadetes bacterium]|nr:tetratricopeptide repeat protein [Armatimonadota bacterium]